MNPNGTNRHNEAWPTRKAVVGSTAIGLPLGLILPWVAGPFGSFLFGWLVVLVVGVVLSTSLSLNTGLQSRARFVLAYAVGVSGGVVVTDASALHRLSDPWWLPLQFTIVLAIVFAVVVAFSTIATGLWALLSWADDLVRKHERLDE